MTTRCKPIRLAAPIVVLGSLGVVAPAFLDVPCWVVQVTRAAADHVRAPRPPPVPRLPESRPDSEAIVRAFGHGTVEEADRAAPTLAPARHPTERRGEFRTVWNRRRPELMILRPSAIHRALGLRSGDRLVSINGASRPTELYQLYLQLRPALQGSRPVPGFLRLRVRRGSEVVVLRYNLV